jgi:hypothetical protein
MQYQELNYHGINCVPPPGPTFGWQSEYPIFGDNWNPQLITCPRHYRETTSMLEHFFYEPGNDRLILHTWMSTTAWPGWSTKRYEFDAETGVLLPTTGGAGIFSLAWTCGGGLGSYNKIYACRNSEVAIREITWDTAAVVEGGWSALTGSWNPGGIYFYAVVNREDGYLVGAANWVLECWRNIGSTPERFAQLRLPNVLSYLCYESRKYCWVITRDGVILKANYQIPRWEMISTVQDPESDTLNYLITFDTKRNRVVVFRARPDAADGACQHQLEFYYPMVEPAYLTQPVPVSSLKTGKRVMLAANLIGDAGEGLTPYTVNGSMVAPVEGHLVTPFSNTEVNGRVCFQYQAPSEACTETLQLTTTVEES